VTGPLSLRRRIASWALSVRFVPIEPVSHQGLAIRAATTITAFLCVVVVAVLAIT